MPEWISNELIGLLKYLLPGLLAAWVFHGLTAHPRRQPFDRVVQALIFTLAVQATTILVRRKLLFNRWAAGLGLAESDAAVLWSVLVAIALGLIFAALANHDAVHRLLRLVGITKRTSFPSEWFSSLSRERRYVVLTLKWERRLYGWPYEWPDNCERGHFVIMQPAWVRNDGSRMRLPLIEKILIPAKEVKWIEFERRPSEHGIAPDSLTELHAPLNDLHKENDHGYQTTNASTSARRDNRAVAHRKPTIRSVRSGAEGDDRSTRSADDHGSEL